MSITLVVCAAAPVDALARSRKAAAPVVGASAQATAATVDEPAEEPSRPPVIEPDAAQEAGTAAEADEAHLEAETTEAAPSFVDRVLANPSVETVVSLLGRGLMVNDDFEEPPLTPVSVRVRTKRGGASLSVFLTF